MLVDGSAGGAFLADLAADGAVMTPLFSENVDEELFDVAPRLVSCPARQIILRGFQKFWGRGMASIVISVAPFEALVQHLKQNLYVEDPDGELCILRFHDPRVLGRLSETLFDDQTTHLFGDAVESYLFEGPDGEVRRWIRPSEVP